MSSKVAIEQYVTDSLTSFGKEVDTNRQLVFVLDGLKPVYRRTIYSSLKFKNKVKTATLVGDVMGTTHPHGDTAIADTVSSLVRWNIFTGQGNHGAKMIYGDDISPSHMRYTEAMLSNTWRSILEPLMPYVEYKEAEISGNKEPKYLPTPLPMTLLYSGLGIGYGINCRYPMFTPQSMKEAYLSDDPMKLEAPFGLILDKNESELQELWDTGLGRLTYKFKVEKTGISSGYGTMITGSPELFKPDLERAFYEERNNGQIYIIDQTAGDIPQVFVGKSANVRAVTLDDIQEVCEQVCKQSKMFRLSVTDGDTSYIIPLKEWLNETYTNYIQVLSAFKTDKIESLKFERKVYEFLPIVTETLLNNRDIETKELAKRCKCDEEVVAAILRKSINTLRHTDSTDKIKDIDAKMKEYQNLDLYKYTSDLIDNMG